MDHPGSSRLNARLHPTSAPRNHGHGSKPSHISFLFPPHRPPLRRYGSCTACRQPAVAAGRGRGGWGAVAKMASHAIFQYNVLAIDDIHNTWTNMIIKMIILRLLGSSDDKEKIGVARPEGPPLWGFRYPVSGRGRGGAAPRGSQGSALKALRIRSTGRTDARGIGASDACRKNRRYDIWCRRETKPSQPMGTG